ncbi:hypothetical protein F4861DRAFT_195710 [Xylaria intraflava]|nr:hypothetical protein F4861DRAFT_195710 [Xylaria intraflava]
MSSMYTVSPASLHDLDDHSKIHSQPPRRIDGRPKYLHNAPVTPESNLLSPYSLHARSDSASPTLNSNTPADTISTTEVYPASSLYTGLEYHEDPFLGTNFDEIPEDWLAVNQAPSNADHCVTYPRSPHLTPSIPTYPTHEPVNSVALGVQNSRHLPTLQEQSINSADSSSSDPQLTPDTNRDSWSTNGSPDQTATAMAAQSPRVMVSLWGRGDDAPIQGVERSFATGRESPRTVRPSRSIAGDLAYERPYESLASIARDMRGDRTPKERTGHRGLAPDERPEEEVLSLNQQEARRQREEKNRDVDAWLSRSAGNVDESIRANEQASDPQTKNEQEDGVDNIPPREIPLGHTTENKYINGQTYFVTDGPDGPITDTDYNYMQYRPWEDPPTLHAIQDKRCQPETSQAAIERFQRQCQDNASIISKAATWGTRRRSLPSISDIEEITTGKVLKKLSISGNSRRPSLLKRVASISRKTSINYRKRKGSNASEQPPDELGDAVDRRGSKDNVTSQPRTPSWVLNAISKKQPYPRLSDAVLAMSTGAATIGSPISPTPITSPKSPLASPEMRQAPRRPRSKTEASRTPNVEPSYPNIVELLKGHGGPPVAQLARTQPRTVAEDEDDDDDDDDGMDENDLKDEQGKINITEPTLDGFRAHILACNPSLAVNDGFSKTNNYLVERMAQQLLNRYQLLLAAKQSHMKLANQGNCPSGSLCPSLGGTTKYLDNRGSTRGIDPLSKSEFSPDEETIPLEGCITAERFPRGIILPPATSLPAEFECPLCFTVKKFQKPSDWTKHVHEDVQPFTCTWDRCREPKMFKRKADWVRHENEGHRQLEWWTCDVDECHHVCYRRDNFLQHLVREHKYTEPKVKTKAAIKKSIAVDRTWQKVEQCHKESSKKPSEEPCCFCGKTFTTWKKLTVHLAKHMEQISLPILGLVMKKEINLDTAIGPVHASLPHHSDAHPQAPTPSIKSDVQTLSPQVPQPSTGMNMVDYYTPSSLGFSPILPQAPASNAYYTQQQTVPSPYPESNNFMMQPQYNARQPYHGLTIPTAAFGHPGAPYALGMRVTDTGYSPAFDSLGIQDPTEGMVFQPLGNPGANPSPEQYVSTQGSVSPYPHSPHQGHNNQFYNS